jgi:hypothetical protein
VCPQFLDLSIPMPNKKKSALSSSSSEVDLHACLQAFTDSETMDGKVRRKPL